MARLQGPKHRMCRRVGERLCENDKCPATKRQQPPGVHGQKGYGRLTEYGTQLREKQKAKYIYGVMERQFRRYYDLASRKSGNTAEYFLQRLERRLDNVVYKMGIAKTRSQARQIVNHGWIKVNDRRVTIPSYQVKVGDVLTMKGEIAGLAVKRNAEQKDANSDVGRWLSYNPQKLEGKILSLPISEDFPPNLNMTLVVEFYSR